MYSNANFWEELKKNPMEAEPITKTIVAEVLNRQWNNLRSLCPSLPEEVKILSIIDEDLKDTYILAWASKSMELKNKSWVPTLHTPGFTDYDFIIGVNPHIPNGWFTGTDCTNIGWRYDLSTVMTHELLHGIGISTSINSDYTLGYFFNGKCYPTLFDEKIQNNNGNYVVDGCQYTGTPGEDLYVNGIQLYHPSPFKKGSSLSHHNEPGHVMHASIAPRRCMDLRYNEFKLLEAMDVSCPVIGRTSDALIETYGVPLLVILFIVIVLDFTF